MSEIRPFTQFIKKSGMKDLIGVEIGVMGGENARTFFEELDMRCLYAIDVYDTYFSSVNTRLSGHGVLDSKEIGWKCLQGAIKNLSKYSNKVIWLIDLSEFAAEKIHEEVDFVYIDGNHRYEFVAKDIELYYPKVRVGGIIGGHDFKTDELGVIKAVTEKFGTEFTHDGWDWWAIRR